MQHSKILYILLFICCSLCVTSTVFSLLYPLDVIYFEESTSLVPSEPEAWALELALDDEGVPQIRYFRNLWLFPQELSQVFLITSGGLFVGIFCSRHYTMLQHQKKTHKSGFFR